MCDDVWRIEPTTHYRNIKRNCGYQEESILPSGARVGVGTLRGVGDSLANIKKWHGLLVFGFWFYSCVVVWFYGFMVSWRIMVLWFYGCMVLLFYGCLMLWFSGFLVLWFLGLESLPNFHFMFSGRY